MSNVRHLFAPRVELDAAPPCPHPQTGIVVLSSPIESLETALHWQLARHRHVDVDVESPAFDDALDEALAAGRTVIDVEADESITPMSLDARGRSLLCEAIVAVSAGGYLVVEGGPGLIYYVQLLVEGEQARLEAVAGRHLFGLRPKIERLRLLGFRSSEESPNLAREHPTRQLRDDPASIVGLMETAIATVYGLAEAPLRLRLRLDV